RGDPRGPEGRLRQAPHGAAPLRGARGSGARHAQLLPACRFVHHRRGPAGRRGTHHPQRLNEGERAMGILSWIILGLIVGILAKWIFPGPQGGGFVLTTLLGIAGAFVGGFIGSLLGLGSVAAFDLRSIALATVGALVLLWGHRALRGGTA